MRLDIDVVEGDHREDVTVVAPGTPFRPPALRDHAESFAHRMAEMWESHRILPRQMRIYVEDRHPLVVIDRLDFTSFKTYAREWINDFFARDDQRTGIRRADKA